LKNSIDVLPSPRRATQADWLHLFGQVAALLQQLSELSCLGIENQVSGSDHPRPPGATFFGSLQRHKLCHFRSGNVTVDRSIRAMKSLKNRQILPKPGLMAK
jgi:hypothetical protein